MADKIGDTEMCMRIMTALDTASGKQNLWSSRQFARLYVNVIMLNSHTQAKLEKAINQIVYDQQNDPQIQIMMQSSHYAYLQSVLSEVSNDEHP